MKKINISVKSSFLLLALTGCMKGNLPPGNNPGKPASDVVGKVTVGYQGWFSAAGDGSPLNVWSHGNLEMWPDTREYTKLYSDPEFYQNGLQEPPFTGTLGNGQPAQLFSSNDQSTLNIHFSWMKQYGIDCAALQRFGSNIQPGSVLKAQRDSVSVHLKRSAETYGVKFYINYDLTGFANLASIKADWTNDIVGGMQLTASSAYAHQNGKVVVSIYGLGYTGNPNTLAQALDLVSWFKSQGCYVIGSNPGQWRTGTGDSQPGFSSLYKSYNMISAWPVGRAYNANYPVWIQGDRDTCKAWGVDYQPCAYPGTSFANTDGQSNKQRNLFPRNHGDFMWAQFAAFKNAGVPSMYIAMFDEMNEATSIMKIAEDSTMIPAGTWFLTLDADGTHVSSDFYLRLTQDGGKMIKGQIPYTTSEPTPFVVN